MRPSRPCRPRDWRVLLLFAPFLVAAGALAAAIAWASHNPRPAARTTFPAAAPAGLHGG